MMLLRRGVFDSANFPKDSRAVRQRTARRNCIIVFVLQPKDGGGGGRKKKEMEKKKEEKKKTRIDRARGP